LLYFSIATFSYYYIFDHRMKLHPRFLKNQVRQEIQFSLEAFPMLDLLTLPWFVGDVRGWSKLYDSMEEGPFGAVGGWQPWAYMLVSACAFLWFTDMCIYWVHRWLHIPVLYKKLHKPHHKWISAFPSLTTPLIWTDEWRYQFPRRSHRTRSTRSTDTSSRSRITSACTSSPSTSTSSSDSSPLSTCGPSL
jgi:sterol desaturase/sphingolipid hydroxylase (fatty acid hydroxylase superfamily)